jgi:nicotinate-nucleotide pyrophosphorylase (carboxylating)
MTVHGLDAWLAEDVGSGDVTSNALLDEAVTCSAEIRLKEPGVICGLDVAADVFSSLGVSLTPLVGEGERADPGPIATLDGPARGVLAGERVALNLIGRLSGIATLTSRYVDAVAGTRAEVLDTRKTTPGLRALEKRAVACGGGTNHRAGLFDAILVKDNHVRLAGGVTAAVTRARERGNGLPVEVEAETLGQVEEALAAGADTILLDNMTLDELSHAVAVTAGRAKLEASGGVTLDTVRDIAETGVDFVSVGALTHSARALDVSLEVLP